MITVTTLYVLVNVAYYTMMTENELLISDAVAVVGIIQICVFTMSRGAVIFILFFNWKMSNHSQSVSFSVWHTDFRQQSSAQDGITGAHTGGHVLSWDHERRDLFSTEV